MSIIGKIIKIFAIVFAICLIAGIILGITNVVDGIEYFTNDNNEENNTVINSNVGDNKLNLDIELAYSSLKIVTGEEYKIESNNEELKISEDENTIFIKDKKKLFNTKNRSVTIYLPDDREFNNINIEAGAGKIEILKGNNISFDLGAGLTVIDELYISNSADINAGAGSFTIKRGNINNLDLDMGVGDTLINSILKGNNKINSGIGKLEINLLDSIDNYTFDIDKGIGEIRINNKDNGTGQNKIYIDGGIGKVNITTVN